MNGDQPAAAPAKKEFVAQVHMGLREKPFVVDHDGSRYELPEHAVRVSGQRVLVVADPSTFTAALKS